ncbi:unnamed protein product [Closterium sp. NIES-53]
MWGPARVRGQGHEHYFLLVVDDYSRYTTVFPLRSKGEVTQVLIDWIRVARLQLRERFDSDFPVLRLHSDRGGEFSSNLLRAFCLAQGIRQTFTLPASPQQNRFAERRIGMVMDVARTSMIHAAAPHFLWPFAVQYAAHQINLQPRVSLPETSPTLRWTGKDVTFDESVPYYHLFPYRAAPLPPPPLFLAPGPPPVDPLPPQGPAPSGVSQVDAVEPAEVAIDSGAGSGGARLEHAEPGGAASRGAEPERAETRGAEPGVAESAGAEPAGAEPGGPSGALSPRELPSPQELREWFARHWSRAAGAGGAAGARGSAAVGGTRAGGAAGATATGGAGAGGAAGVGAPGGTGVGAAVSAAGPTGAGAAGGTGAGGAAGVGADAGGAGFIPAGSGGAARPRPHFVPLLEQLASPLLAPSPYAGPTGGLAEHCEPESRPASLVRPARTSRRVSRQRLPAVPGMHQMALRPSTASQRVPMPSPPASSLLALPDPESDSLRATSPTVTRFLATAVSDPSFESAAASPLVAELVDFAAQCRLDYAASLVAESAFVCPPSVGGECALSTDVLEDRQEEFQCFAAALPHLVSLLLASEGDPDAPDIPTLRSYAEAIEGPYSFSGRQPWTQRWLLGSPQAPTTSFLQGSLHEEIWLRRPPSFIGSFPPGTQWSLRRPVYGLRQAPREWHDTLRTTLAAVGFAPSSADPSLFLCTDTSAAAVLHPRVLQRFDFTYSSPQATPLSTCHSLSALPSDESVEPSGPYPELVGCLITSGMGLVLGGRSPVVLTGHIDASSVDDLVTQRSSQGYTFSLAMAAHELHWLTYLLTDLGEPPRSPPVLYVDNKAMLALCREHRLEHRTKHIALRYFLACELQQRGQLRLAYVASQANTADIFTKALQPCDHQCFCTMLGDLAATGTPALPSPAVAVIPPLLSPAVSATTPAGASGTPALPSPAAAVTRSLLSPPATASAPAAALVTPPLLSPAAAMTPPLRSPAAAIETAPVAIDAAAVPSQTAHAPLSPTGGDAAHRPGNVQCVV